MHSLAARPGRPWRFRAHRTLALHVEKRLAEGRAHKTVNLELGIVRRVLNLCATSWRDEGGLTWLDQAPKITLLPLAGNQREPRPIGWPEQPKLLPKLPAHLARMSLFTLNTGARDDVVCSLRWEWGIEVPELGISVFEVPAVNVKGRKRSRLLVCNSVAQSALESVRGEHDEFVFVYQRLKKGGGASKSKPHPVETMNNTAWQRARRAHDPLVRSSTAEPKPLICMELWSSVPTHSAPYWTAFRVQLPQKSPTESRGRHPHQTPPSTTNLPVLNFGGLQ